MVFDDDGSGEAADIVCLRTYGERLEVHLYHCKFSGGAKPGARIEDLYAVCGQAQRSIALRADVRGLLMNLRRRDDRRRRTAERAGRPFVTRFERGNAETLKAMVRDLPRTRPEFTISIVQPGLSRSSASPSQLELLAVTETYLKDTYGIAMRVHASA